jgi:hypothetical protein
MSSDGTFMHVEAGLLDVLEEIRRREPIFHTPEFGRTVADFERMMAPDYWEVGASGRRYSRNFILRWLSENPPVDASAAGWQSDDHEIRPLASDTFLLTYRLRQGPRLTRRATIWQKTPEGWRILYHQGTIVGTDEDDAAAPGV